MYCRSCGKNIDDSAIYCINCGTRFDNKEVDDQSSFGFAILGFFIPIVGLILFLIYEGKKPKRAKSAGKGALIGFITKIVLSIILVILYVVFAASLFSNISDDIESNIPAIGDVFREEYKQYMTWNGRSVLQIILKFSMLMPKSVFNIINSLCYVATTVLVYWNIKGRKKYDVFLLTLINLCIWNFCVDFSQTILWLAGA